MSDIPTSLRDLRNNLPAGVKIVAVSKTRSVSEVLTAYEAGQRIFGENRVQEILAKKDQLPADISWHLIGHLQTNKVRQIISHVSLIHSVDSPKLLQVIDSEAAKAGIVVNCLLQIHIAREESKTGFSIDEVLFMLAADWFRNLRNTRVTGLMGMATFTDDKEVIRNEFAGLKKYFDGYQGKILRN
ncbi:MAG: YggS family pyridoxal phosphate-dependent enzyme [Bacteroidales bacterium]